MLSKKLLKIEDCYFALPDDFTGTLGEALMLLAEYRLKAEKEQKITTKSLPSNCYDELKFDDDIKCSMLYRIYQISEDGTKWDIYDI